MGFPHIAHKKKVEAVSYTLLGKSQVEASILAGVKASNLTYWTKKPDIVAEAQQLIEAARRLARETALIRRGYKKVGNRMISPEGLEKMREAGRIRGAANKAMALEQRRAMARKGHETRKARQSKESGWSQIPEGVLPEGFTLPRNVRYKDGFIYTPKRRYSLESYVNVVRQNREKLAQRSPEERREIAQLGALAKQLKRLEK